jgi:hypothetical protein
MIREHHDVHSPEPLHRVAAVLLLLWLAPLNASAADWPNEPTGYRRLPFGAGDAAAKMMLNNINRCTSDQGAGILTCTDTLKSFVIGHVRIGERLLFPNGQFSAAFLEFSSDQYPFMRRVFIEKYGQPTRTRSSNFMTKGGGVFENETLEWEGTNVVVILERFGDSVDNSNATIATNEFFRGQAEREKELMRRAVLAF